MLECPYCHETEPSLLQTRKYKGLKDSSHIECETCGQEFTHEDAEKAAELSKNIKSILQHRSG
jgi:transcriptional regulator NrdR family protein